MNSSSKICPFCYSEIKEIDDTVVCKRCGAEHHKNCWQVNGGCGNPDCGFREQNSGQQNLASAGMPQANAQYNTAAPYNSQTGYANPGAYAQQSAQPPYTAQSPYTAQAPYTAQTQSAAQSQNTYGGYSQQGYSMPEQYIPEWAKREGPQGNVVAVKARHPVRTAVIIVSIVLIVIAGIVVGALTLVNNIKADMLKAQNSNSCVIGGNFIPSVKRVVGERQITFMTKYKSSNLSYITYIYKSDDPESDINQYADYLKKHTNFGYDLDKNNKDGKTVLVTEAEEDNKILYVEITPDTDGYTITYRLTKGVIITV